MICLDQLRVSLNSLNHLAITQHATCNTRQTDENVLNNTLDNIILIFLPYSKKSLAMSIKKHFAPLFSDPVWFIFCDTDFILRKLVTTLPVKEINLISAEGAIFSSPV